MDRRASSSRESAADRAGALVLARTRRSPWFEGHLCQMAGVSAHGNRRLTCDKLLLALLLSFFDPTARSLCRIEAHGDFGGQLDLGPDLRRLARSTTADALAALNPQCLLPLIEDLQARCPGLCHDDPALHVLTQRIIAADGTYFTTACDVAWALRHTKSNGKKQGQVRVNLQLDTANWCPQIVTVSGKDGHSEAAAFMPDLLPGVLYVVDRNFVVFPFLRRVLELGSEFIVRGRATAPTLEVLETSPLTPADEKAGVTTDEVVRFTGVYARRAGLNGRTFRRVTLRVTDRDGKSQSFSLLTSLTDSRQIPAATVAAAYRRRWQIELRRRLAAASSNGSRPSHGSTGC